MFYFKACPKCRGDLYQRADIYGRYIACIQCSHYLTEAEEAQLTFLSGRLTTQPVALTQKEKAAA